MKLKKKTALAAAVLLVVLIAVLGAKPAWYFVQDLTFSWTERSETEWKVKAYAEEHGAHFADYPQSLIELLERNPETEAFVLGYPFWEEGTVDLTDYETGNAVPLFLQWDPNWGYEKYGRDFLAVTGCGPTCLAMAGYYLTGEESFNPKAVADFAAKNGYYAAGYGSSWTLISEGAGKLGLTAEELPLVKGKIVNAVENGHPVILALGKGDFTSSGHYIVLTGWEENAFRVNDPNSRVRSEKLWTYEELESQIRNIWEISV